MSISERPDSLQVDPIGQLVVSKSREGFLDDPCPETAEFYAEAFRKTLQRDRVKFGRNSGRDARWFCEGLVEFLVTPETPILPVVESWVLIDEEVDLPNNDYWRKHPRPLVETRLFVRCELGGCAKRADGLFVAHYTVSEDAAKAREVA